MQITPHIRVLLVLNGLVLLAVLAFFISSFKGDGPSGSGPDQRVRSINLNRDFSLCGEKFPMDNWDVRQRLDAELLRNIYFHSQTILAIKRANAVFPIIEPILKEEGVPEDLKYLAVAESALQNAISPAGARGVWQFMKSAADQYGLEVNSEIDERYDLEKATHAACKYMKAEKESLGSWVLAMAAYNGGHGRISVEMDKQRAQNFFELNLAADETMRYPFRIMAIKEVMTNPADYDYEIDAEHLYPPNLPFSTVDVSGSVDNWGDFAKKNGTNYRMLKLLNPWLIDNKLTNKSGKKYVVRIPK
jgi:membrane-bound lytic murein transglycosylase D